VRRIAAVALVLGQASCGGESAPAMHSIVLVTLDTTRPDTLGAYGGPPGATPFLDALATQSLVYDRAYTVAPLTQPAHSSIFTGLYPPRHGVRINGIGSLSEDAHTLAELAHEAGYQTGAFVGALVLDPAFGLDQGFERYTGPKRGFGSEDSHIDDRPAGEVVDDALAWLAARDPERPYLAWVHVFDPHGPYAPPERFRLGHSPRTLYQGEVAYVDRQLARLFATLLAGGPEEAPLVVVVADHGEAFGEHGEQTHGLFCYDTTLHVPLLVRYPDGYRAGERSDEVVSVVDLFPTLAEAMGQRVDGVDGQSLYHRRADADRGVYFESYEGFLAYGTSPLAGWLDGAGKYVHSSHPQFFELAGDPGEEHDLAALRTERLGPYRDALARLASKPRLALGARSVSGGLDAALRKLGYAAAGAAPRVVPDPLDAGTRPSPPELAGPISDTLRAQELSNQGRLGEAETLLRRVVAEVPENWFALDRLATALIRQGRHREALPLLRRVTAEGSGWPGSWYNLGAA